MPPAKCPICSAKFSEDEAEGRCTGCKSIRYCSENCQRIDWPLHKILCQKYADFEKNNPRPADIVDGRKTTSHKLAILFSGDSTNVELIWLGVEFGSEIDEKNGTVWEFYSSTYDALWEYLGGAEGIEIVVNGRIVEIMVGGGTLGREANKAIDNLSKGYGFARTYGFSKSYGIGSIYSGNLVITHKKTETHPAKSPLVNVHHDVTLEDFRYGFNFITRKYNVFDCSHINKFVIRGADNWTKGVMVKCPKDTSFTKANTVYHELLLKHQDSFHDVRWGTSTHRIFKTQEICSISEQMGMELSFEELGCPTFRQPDLGTCHGYRPLAFLLIDADPESEIWGTELRKKSSKRDYLSNFENMQDAINAVGKDTENLMHTTIFVRKDKKPLTRFQVEALAAFSQEVFCPAMSVDEEEDGTDEEVFWPALSVDEDEDGTDEEVFWPAMSMDEEDDGTDEDGDGDDLEVKRLQVVEQYLRLGKFEEYFFAYKQQKIDAGDTSWALTAPPPRRYRTVSEHINTAGVKSEDDAEIDDEKRERAEQSEPKDAPASKKVKLEPVDE